MRRLVLLLIMGQVLSLIAYGQPDITYRLSNGLIFHYPFDGQALPEKNSINAKWELGKGSPSIYQRGFLNYPKDSVLSLACSTTPFWTIRDVVEGNSFPRTYSLWFRLSHKAAGQCAEDSGKLNFSLSLSDGLFALNSRLKSGRNKLQLETAKDTLELFTYEPNKWYLIKFEVANSPASNQSIRPKIALEIYEAINSTGSLTLQKAKLEKVDLNAKWPKEQSAQDLVNLPVTFTFRRNETYGVALNDFRVYNRNITENDIVKLPKYKFNDGKEGAKYELAYTYKKIGDEFFINSNPAKALEFYSKSELLLDSAKGIDEDLLSEYNELYPFYLKLLRKDVHYRKSLIDAGYSFWGREYSMTPLYPVQEYESFIDVYDKFIKNYGRIEDLLKDAKKLTDEEIKQQIRSSIALYQTEIGKVKVDEANYDLDFYQEQIGACEDRIKAIEQEQMEIDNEVKSYNKQLAENEKAVTGIISKGLTQSTLGVSVDFNKSLSDNFKTVAFQYLAGNSQLKTDLLGGFNDIVTVTQASYDYYKKAKDGIAIVKKVAKGNMSMDDLVRVGDMVGASGLVDQETINKWNDLKKDYENVKGNIQEVKKIKKQAEELFDKVKDLKNADYEKLVDMVDWIAESGYFKDYEQDFQRFKGFREEAYQAIKTKKYQSLMDLGTKILDTILSNPNNPELAKLKTTIDALKQDYKKVKPLFTALEMVGQDKQIKDALGDLFITPGIYKYVENKAIAKFIVKELNSFLANPAIETKNFRDQIVIDLAQNVPNVFVEAFPSQAKELLKMFGKIDTDAELFQLIRTSPWFRHPEKGIGIVYKSDTLLKVSKDTLYVKGNKFKLFLDPLQVDETVILPVFKKIVKQFNVRSKFMDNIAMSSLYELFGDEHLVKFKDLNYDYNKGKIYDLLINQLSGYGHDSDVVKIRDQGFKILVGGNVMDSYIDQNQDNIHKELPPVNENIYMAENAVDMEAEVTKQLATKALDMAFPGAGVATSAVLDIAKSILDSYDIIDQLKKAYDRKMALREELLSQLNQLRTVRRNKELAYYEKDIAVLNLELANKQREEFSKLEFDQILTEKQKVRAKIAGELPLFYFMAERLRYFYNRLNKASTFWYGSANNLETIVEQDPGSIRLALDQSIKLFDWIYNPDITSSREDIDAIVGYWKRKHALVSDPDYRNKLQYGGKEMQLNYHVVNVAEAYKEEWKRFNSWRSGGILGKDAFEFELDFTEPLSNMNSLGFDEDFTSVKTIKVCYWPVATDKQVIQNVVEVHHPGLSFNENGELQILKEKPAYSTAEVMNLNATGQVEIADPKFIQNIKQRWANTNAYQPFDFEGYNLRSKWKLKVLPKPGAANIDNLYLMFVYQFTKGKKVEALAQPRYRYKVEVVSNVVQQFDIMCTEGEMKNYEESLKQAVKSGILKSGKITRYESKDRTYEIAGI